MEITLRIEAPELAEALNNLASAMVEKSVCQFVQAQAQAQTAITRTRKKTKNEEALEKAKALEEAEAIEKAETTGISAQTPNAILPAEPEPEPEPKPVPVHILEDLSPETVQTPEPGYDKGEEITFPTLKARLAVVSAKGPEYSQKIKDLITATGVLKLSAVKPEFYQQIYTAAGEF